MSRFYDQLITNFRAPYRLLSRYGYNSDVDGGGEIIWFNGGSYTRPTAADQMNVVSSSTADDEGSTGAEIGTLHGLNANFDPISESITLNGTSNVLSSLSYIAVNDFVVTQVGSGNRNAGTISATDEAASFSKQLCVKPFFNQSLSPVYTVPRGYEGWIVRWGGGLVDEGAGETLELVLQMYEGEETSIRKALDSIWMQNSDGHFKEVAPIYVPEKSCVLVEGFASHANKQVYGGFDMVIVPKLDTYNA